MILRKTNPDLADLAELFSPTIEKLHSAFIFGIETGRAHTHTHNGWFIPVNDAIDVDW